MKEIPSRDAGDWSAVIWCCEGCGEQFYKERISHGRAEHTPGCDGNCRNCPVEVECGPISMMSAEPANDGSASER